MKTLIIYFSHAGENWMKNGLEKISKGNTEIVAEKLQKLTDAEIFKVEEVHPYSESYYKCCDEAKVELTKNARPQIKNYLKSMEGYELIYICSPIWWGHLPMPLFSALENLDFSGKIVKFVITHEGSGLGNTQADIKKLCKNAEIKQGLAIRGHTANFCDEELKNYLKNC